jgi:DNA-binding MarR family transcriptional regulator
MPQQIEFRFNNPDDSPGYLLWQLTTCWQRKLKRELDKLDITHTQFVLLASLAWLSKKKEAVTQVDIATQSKTDRMMVSKVLRTLQSKGLIHRQEHATDTRAKTVSLTPQGALIIQQALIVVEQVDIDFFAILEDQLPGFNRNMLKLIQQKG